MEVQSKNLNHPVSAGMTLLLLLLAIVGTSVIGMALLYLISIIKGIPLVELGSQLSLDSHASERNFSRLLVLQNHLFTFILPTLIASWMIFKSEWAKTLGFKPIKRIFNPLLGAGFLILAIPMTGILYWINQKIPLPEFMLSLESSTNEMIQSLLMADSIFEMAFNIFIIGVLPAIGEEICFRGFIQRQLSRLFQNPHIGIVVAAIIFSAIHMQFQGFLPRFFLGVLLGYLFYWTGNIWIPIVAHFAHNSFQVIGVYLSEEKIQEMDITAVEMAPLPQLAIFTSLAILIGYYIYQVNKGNRLSILHP